jgi:transcriptional regulator NrdR family protein
MSLHVLTEATVATRKRTSVRAVAKVKRNGKPLTVYLNDKLSLALATACEKRRVDKSVVVRVAVERLLNDLEAGQLELPLGI